jgi:hypothetical protein
MCHKHRGGEGTTSSEYPMLVGTPIDYTEQDQLLEDKGPSVKRESLG